MAAPFATTAGVPATIVQRSGVPRNRAAISWEFSGVARTPRGASWVVQESQHTSSAGH
jgi:hypothetical protein